MIRCLSLSGCLGDKPSPRLLSASYIILDSSAVQFPNIISTCYYVLLNGTAMTARSFRDVVNWVALANALVLFPFDWYWRSSYSHIRAYGYGETATPGV
jgi:hypothetical protein